MSTVSARALVALALVVPSLLAAPSSHAATHLIEIADGSFVPSVLTVAAGDTLRVVNLDDVPHTFTAEDRSFDSGRLMQGDSTQMVLSATGAHGFRCTLGGQQVRVHVEVGRGAERRGAEPHAAGPVMHRSGRSD